MDIQTSPDPVARAREHHLDRIRTLKSQGRLRAVVGKSRVEPAVDRTSWLVESQSGEDPLDVVRRHSPMSPGHIEVKRLYVAEQRSRVQHELRRRRDRRCGVGHRRHRQTVGARERDHRRHSARGLYSAAHLAVEHVSNLVSRDVSVLAHPAVVPGWNDCGAVAGCRGEIRGPAGRRAAIDSTAVMTSCL